jgi:hypothetical protein
MVKLWRNEEQMMRWKFGREQTLREERAEIAAAQRSGRVEAYVRGQRYAQLIEAETERRRARHRRGDRPAAGGAS